MVNADRVLRSLEFGGHISRREAIAKVRLSAGLYITAFVNGVFYGLLDQTTFEALKRGFQMIKRIPTKQRTPIEKFLIQNYRLVIEHMGLEVGHQYALRLASVLHAALH